LELAALGPRAADQRGSLTHRWYKESPMSLMQGATMSWKFVVSVAVMFLMLFVLGWAGHSGLLAADYAKIQTLLRPMPEVWLRFPLVLLAQLLTALAFTWIYLQGKEDKPWLAQGIRYGIAIAVLGTIPVNLIHYAVMPFPPELVLKQMGYDGLTIVLMAIVLAWINRQRVQGATQHG
jgi:MFS superfamily sulfate permease-like transporter